MGVGGKRQQDQGALGWVVDKQLSGTGEDGTLCRISGLHDMYISTNKRQWLAFMFCTLHTNKSTWLCELLEFLELVKQPSALSCRL